MDPIMAALFVGASFTTSLATNKNTARIENTQNKINVEQARLQASEAAYERSKQFTQNISMNLALKGMGFGGVSGFRGVSSRSASEFAEDINSLNRHDVFSQITGEANRALTKAKRFKSNVGAAGTAASLASQLGLFTGGGK